MHFPSVTIPATAWFFALSYSASPESLFFSPALLSPFRHTFVVSLEIHARRYANGSRAYASVHALCDFLQAVVSDPFRVFPSAKYNHTRRIASTPREQSLSPGNEVSDGQARRYYILRERERKRERNLRSINRSDIATI